MGVSEMNRNRKIIRRAKARAAAKDAREKAQALDARQRLAQWAKSLPEISIGDAFTPGKVTHMCMSHDDHCPTLRTGNGFDCRCNPDVSYHRQSE
jgi:hypothetical protein